MHQAKTYGGWLRNPAHPKGWLKPEQNNGMFTIYQLVRDFATIRSIKPVRLFWGVRNDAFGF